MKAKVYTRELLSIFNLLEHPVWVFDITTKSMWWANNAAVVLWNSESLDELLVRNFQDMSEKSAQRMTGYLEGFQTRPGETILDQWTRNGFLSLPWM
jgi:hypothetical protein